MILNKLFYFFILMIIIKKNKHTKFIKVFNLRLNI